jgi:hypothetical protein
MSGIGDDGGLLRLGHDDDGGVGSSAGDDGIEVSLVNGCLR